MWLHMVSVFSENLIPLFFPGKPFGLFSNEKYVSFFLHMQVLCTIP